MLIMAEVTSEMGAELRAAALASHTSVAVEVGRRLERLARLEERMAELETGDSGGSVRVSTVVGSWLKPPAESLYSGPPNPFDMLRSTGRGR
jgi:hypothetical protein